MQAMNFDPKDHPNVQSLISVVMPVYNGERYLQEAAESILNQTHKNLELLIINDGSSDSTARIIHALARLDTRVRVLANERNLGVAASLNRGVLEAKGEFLARMDSDDESFPDRLTAQLEYLQLNPSVDIVGSSVEVFRETEGTSSSSNRVISLPSNSEMVHWSMLFYCALAHPTVMGRVGWFKDHPYPTDAPNCEDYTLWLRSLSTVRMANVSRPLLRLRKHAHGTVSVCGQRRGALQAGRACWSALLERDVTQRELIIAQNPSEAQTFDECESAFSMIANASQKLNDLFTKRNKTADLSAFQADTNARLGECVSYSLKLNILDGIRLRQKWLVRNPPPTKEQQSVLF
eukprot:205747_1